jgi:hypothetical protein
MEARTAIVEMETMVVGRSRPPPRTGRSAVVVVVVAAVAATAASRATEVTEVGTVETASVLVDTVVMVVAAVAVVVVVGGGTIVGRMVDMTTGTLMMAANQELYVHHPPPSHLLIFPSPIAHPHLLPSVPLCLPSIPPPPSSVPPFVVRTHRNSGELLAVVGVIAAHPLYIVLHCVVPSKSSPHHTPYTHACCHVKSRG